MLIHYYKISLKNVGLACIALTFIFCLGCKDLDMDGHDGCVTTADCGTNQQCTPLGKCVAINDDTTTGTDTVTDITTPTDTVKDTTIPTDTTTSTDTVTDTNSEVEERLQHTSCPVYVSKEGAAQNAGTSWQDALVDVNAALQLAEQYLLDVPNTFCQVWVGQGTYKPSAEVDRTATFTLPSGAHLYGGFFGNETTVEQRDYQTNVTIFSGDLYGDDGADGTNNEDNSYHIFTGIGEVVLNGIVVDGGNAGLQPDYISGGGIYIVGAIRVDLINCTFRNNTAQFGGGGISVSKSSSADIFIDNCQFENNGSGEGGAIRIAVTKSVSITSSTFLYNFSGTGGAIYLAEPKSGNIRSCGFHRNSSYDAGGALFSKYCNVAIANSVFEKNVSRAGGGGGACIMGNGKEMVQLTNNVFWANESYSQGGALSFGVWGGNSINTTVLVIGNSFIENQSGGGLDLLYSKRPMIVNNSILGDEVAPHINGDVTVSNSYIPGGCAGLDILCTDGIIGHLPEHELKFVDAENGDFRLAQGSAAIDAGSNEHLPIDLFDVDSDGDTEEALPFDFDGNPRVVNETVDLGAFEYQN